MCLRLKFSYTKIVFLTLTYLFFHIITPSINIELEFKVVYVGSAENSDKDQILQTVMVGPVPVGVSKFMLEARCPDPSFIPPSDALGITVVLLQCSYKGNEFVRVGYYVNNDYQDMDLCESPPPVTNFDLLVRSILAEEPRITRFSIPWDNNDDNSDIINIDEADPDRMEVSGEEELEEDKNEEDIIIEPTGNFTAPDIDENYEEEDDDNDDEYEEEEEEEEEDIENVEHDLEEDEEKFKQKRHLTANSSGEVAKVSITNVGSFHHNNI